MNARWGSALVAFVAVAITAVFFIDLCDAVYDCGCTHLWAGAADRCNVHHPTGRHCPWCTLPATVMAPVFFAIVLPQIALAFYPRRWLWWQRLVATVLWFPAFGALEAFVVGFITGYWYE